jgi:hypothetical protein
METIMSTEKKGETSKQKPKASEPVAKTKKGEIELSEKELARTTGGGTGQRMHKPIQ